MIWSAWGRVKPNETITGPIIKWFFKLGEKQCLHPLSWAQKNWFIMILLKNEFHIFYFYFVEIKIEKSFFIFLLFPFFAFYFSRSPTSAFLGKMNSEFKPKEERYSTGFMTPALCLFWEWITLRYTLIPLPPKFYAVKLIYCIRKIEDPLWFWRHFWPTRISLHSFCMRILILILVCIDLQDETSFQCR